MKDVQREKGTQMSLKSDERATPELQRENQHRIRKSRKKPELPEGVMVTGGQIVAIKRREHNWSQDKLSEKTEISRTQIGRIERDECIPSVRSIEKLEEVLGVELYDLFMAQKWQQAMRQKEIENQRYNECG